MNHQFIKKNQKHKIESSFDSKNIDDMNERY